MLLTVGSVLAPLLIGIALGDLLHGLPINSSQNFTGSFWDLLQPYAVFTGVTLVLICLLHGATFLCLKTTGEHARAVRLAGPPGGPVHRRRRHRLHHLDARDRQHDVLPQRDRTARHPRRLAAVWLVYDHRDGFAFAATTVTIAACIVSIFVDLYPNVMVSSHQPAYNLTVHNTASGAYSLKAMTVVVIIFLPLVLAYQTWTYYVFRRRVSRSANSSPPGTGHATGRPSRPAAAPEATAPARRAT